MNDYVKNSQKKRTMIYEELGKKNWVSIKEGNIYFWKSEILVWDNFCYVWGIKQVEREEIPTPDGVLCRVTEFWF